MVAVGALSVRIALAKRSRSEDRQPISGHGVCIAAAENDYVTGYSINSSTLASSVGGTVRPSALAVLRFMISSNAVACRTGRSAGFVPLRIWPAYVPAWR